MAEKRPPMIRFLADRTAQLRAVPIFAELDEPALERVAALATEVEFPAATVLIERDQPASGMFVILNGQAKVHLRGTAVELGPGEFVGELSLLAHDLRRTARVSAATPVRCLAIARADFADLIESEPRIAVAMLPALARRLAGLIDDRRH